MISGIEYVHSVSRNTHAQKKISTRAEIKFGDVVRNEIELLFSR